MAKTWSRALSLLLTLCLLATLVAVPAAAEEPLPDGTVVTVRYFPVKAGGTDVAAAGGYTNDTSFFTLTLVTGEIKIDSKSSLSLAFNGGGQNDRDVTLTDYLQLESSKDFTIGFTAPYAGTFTLYCESGEKKINYTVDGGEKQTATGADTHKLVVPNIPGGEILMSRNQSLKIFCIEYTYTVGAVILDKKPLTDAITAAQGKLSGVLESADGTDVTADKTWATAEDIQTLTGAIAAAQTTLEEATESVKATQDALDQAVTDLNAAAEVFTPQQGTFSGVDENYTVTSVTLKKGGQDAGESIVLPAGETLTLTADVVVDPADGTDVKWESSDAAVATVKDGVVTGVAEGDATITATSAKNVGKKDSVVINVRPKRVEMSAMGVGLAVGDTLALTAQVKAADERLPDALTWSSSDAGVAAVDAQGAVTAAASGTAVISAQTAAGVKGTCVVVVAPDPTAAVAQPGTFALTPTGYTDRTPIAPGARLDSAGYFTAVGDGELLERFQSKTSQVQVGPTGSSAVQFTVTGKATSVTIGYGSTSDSNTSAIALADQDGELMTSKAGSTVTTLKGKGPSTIIFESLAAGTYHIIAPTVAGEFASDEANPNKRGVRLHTVSVVQAAASAEDDKVSAITVSGPATVLAGESITLTPAVAPNSATNKSVTWSSSDDTLATVSADGVVTGVAQGEVTITATAQDGSGVEGTKAITVQPARQLVTAIAVTAAGDATEVEVLKTLQLTAAVRPETATDKTVTWSSSDDALATVSAAGLVTGRKAGNVTITATAADGSKVTGHIDLTVTGEVGEIVVDPGDAAANRFVLDVNGLTPGTYTNTAPKAGTAKEGAGYFTIYYSKEAGKGLVDAMDMPVAFEDGYVATRRINFGGASKGVTERVVAFTTANNKATVTVWWAAGGDVGGSNDGARHVVIWDGAKASVASASPVANGQSHKDTFTLGAAGTYAVAGDPNTCFIYKIEVNDVAGEEDPDGPGTKPPASGATTLDASADLTAFAQGAKKDGDTQKVKDYFTIYWSAKSKVDANAKDKFRDDTTGYASTQRVSFGGTSVVDATKTLKNIIAFETKGEATVKLWWVQQGGVDSNDAAKTGPVRNVYIVNAATGATVAKTSETGTGTAADTSKKNDGIYSELAIPAAGTYYIANLDDNNNLCRVEVVEKGATQEPGPNTPASKDALNAAITAAAKKAEDAYTVADGTTAEEVENGKKFVTESTKAGLLQAVEAARKVAAKDGATEAEIAKAVTDLKAAEAAFDAATLTGTRSVTVSTGGGGGHSSSRPNSTTTSTAADGSVTTTTADSRGNITQVTKRPDGTVSKTAIAANGVITQTVTQPDGSESVRVTETDGAVSITATAGGETLARVNIPATLPTVQSFEDVPAGHWAEKAIYEMAALELVKGVDAGGRVYNTDAPITRASVANILFRLSDGKEGMSGAFSDVASGQWYADCVAWAAKTGVVTGYADGTFGPDEAITREQMAAMIVRYAKLLGLDTAPAGDLSAFADGAAIQPWAADSMVWCVSQGILKGKDGGRLDGSATATRAEAALMLDRLIALIK